MIIRLVVVLFSVLSSLYLHSYDISNKRFFEVGWNLLLYNFLRCCWVPIFLWIICGTGYYFINQFKGRLSKDLSTLDRCIVSFFVGGAVLTIGIFCCGLASFLYYPVFLGACAFSILVLPNVLKGSHFNYQFYSEPTATKINRFEHILEIMPQVMLGFTLLVLAGIIILTRTLSPVQINNDSYEHYLPFQIQAVLNHSILPNDVWYEFFNSKGLSLNLASILLTGILGPQLISFCYVIATSAVVYSIVSKVTAYRFLAWLGACLVLPCFITTGSFSSHHVQMAGWISGLLWLTALSKLYEAPTLRGMHFILAVVLVGFTIFFPLAVMITLPFFGILVIARAITGRRERARQYLLYSLITLATFLVILGINYLISGMFFFEPTHFFWDHANKAHLGLKCHPYMLDFFSNRADATKMPHNLVLIFKQIPWHYVFRFDLIRILYPLRFAWNNILLLIGLILFFFVSRKRFPESSSIILVIVSLVLASVIASSLTGQGTHASIGRNFIFMVVPLTILALMVWGTVLEVCKNFIERRTKLYVCAVGSIALSWYFLQPYFSRDLVPYLSFAIGKKSIRSIFAECEAWASRVRWISSVGQEDAWRISLKDDWLEAKLAVGMDTPVLSLMQPSESYPTYMFPGNGVLGTGVLTEPTRTCLQGRWQEVVYGDAPSAKKALSELGINFFILRFAPSDHPDDFYIEGIIPFSDLFDPSIMGEYFDVFWNKQDFYILTWRGHGIGSLSKEFLERWRILRASAHYRGLQRYFKTEYLSKK